MPDGIQTRKDARGRKRYRASVYVPTTRKRAWGPWGTHAEAKAWRLKAQGEIAAGTRSTATTTLREEWEAFIAGAEAGTIHDRTGTPYKPATLRGYRRAWAKIDPELGAHRLGDVKRADVQGFVDRLAADAASPSTIRNTLDPLRAVYRRALQRDRVAVNPTVGLDLPRANGGRERVASAVEAARLIAALPAAERALWATAFYGGLRRGELRALRWNDVQGDVIHVARSWDDHAGEQTPKTRAGTRRVPIAPQLRVLLDAHRAFTGRAGPDLVFGTTASEPFTPSTVRRRALAAWKAQRPPLTPIALHEARHACASLLIAAGCNVKALSVVMGHSTIGMTMDTYGHMLPGGEAEVGKLLGAFLGAS